MFLSMNWISDFVDLSGLDRRALIHNFTLSTAEVEDIIIKGEDTYGVIVAKILTVENHPNSKKLHLLKVDTGSGVVDIVCGAPNVREGMLVALATDGGAVSGHKITPATIAGYTSYGMCCSESELGISDDNSGIWDIEKDLPEGVALGTDIKDIFDIDDIIFEVDNKSLTNRPDLWGHYGIAREFATITGRELKAPDTVDLSAYDGLPTVAVDVRATDLVWRYSAIKVDNILRKTSPANMRIRLYYCGSRAINFLADLTNYVMMEEGQPMHAFDLKRVDKIEVQTFPMGTKFTTLDGEERNIDDKMLMITSGDEPVAIAGVMGGDASKIEDDTTSLLLESATFDGVSVRKTTTRLGLRTDASQRYEKMLDPELCRTATARLLALLFEYDKDATVISRFEDVYVNKYPTITLEFDRRYVDRYTGIDIPDETIVKTLRGLGFTVSQSGDSFTVTVPSWRATKDVTIKADIIEEITRIYGYDNFNVCTSSMALVPVRPETLKTDEDRMKDILVKSYRMHEVHSYIWSDSAKNAELGIDTPKNVSIINAQTPDHAHLRVSMIPTLLAFAKENRGYKPDFAIFELGHTVEGLRDDGTCLELHKLGAVLYSKTRQEESLFLECRDAVLEICEDILHKTPTFSQGDCDFDFEHPANTFDVFVDGVRVGYISVPHPSVLANIDKKCAVAFFELSTEAFAGAPAGRNAYVQPSKFPGLDIDLTFLGDVPSVRLTAVRKAAEAVSEGLLSSVSFKDIYTDDEGVSALTLRFSFVSQEKTLSKQELAPVVNAVTGELEKLGLVMKA
ncbi:MAG: phenylalanine--tRNA ligase subunit beta [Clostridia bacterium]|nr:phenylalanine--tRNA ligase subunit beta [Clostridia bacterium]